MCRRWNKCSSKMKFVFNPFPYSPWFLRVCSTILFKTLWEKEKLLITSNFSFSHGVFWRFGELSGIFIKYEFVVCKLFQFGRVQNLLSGKGLKGSKKGLQNKIMLGSIIFVYFLTLLIPSLRFFERDTIFSIYLF